MLARSLLALSLVMSPLALVRGFVPHAPVQRLRSPALRAGAATIRMMADGKAEVSERWLESWACGGEVPFSGCTPTYLPTRVRTHVYTHTQHITSVVFFGFSHTPRPRLPPTVSNTTNHHRWPS